MSNFPIQQFKLITGEEVICEIMEWENEDGFIIIKNAMDINISTDREERIYMFKPWFLYVEKDDEYVFLDSNKIVGNCKPNDLLALQYYAAVEDMAEIAKERVADFNKREAYKLKEILEELAEFKEKTTDIINQKTSKTKDDKESKPKNNVIPFTPPDTVH